MEGKIPNSRKRPYLEEVEEIDEANRPPKQKKVRFPKGRKVKSAEEEKIDITKILEEEEEKEGINIGCDLQNPKIAAKERAKRRNLITADLFNDETNDTYAAEVTYEDNENFIEDGIQLEPFNLDKEREEGYFDAQGNFVEYVSEKEIKDAWLDSVAVDPRYAGKASKVSTEEDDSRSEVTELSSEDIGLIKKRIASVLEPGETVLQALRRLKGGSNNRKQKMSPETQLLFDQLTEDANKLLDQGEYNVYHDKQEVFQREADGYEKLALARGKTTSLNADMRRDILSDLTEMGGTSSNLFNSDVGASNANVSTAETLSNAADDYDMFADDEADNDTAKPSPNSSNLVSESNSKGVSQPSLDGQTTVSGSGALQDDYVYDETSGYYYNGSTGYYYDPSTGLYCYATSGQWYSYNSETGSYDEVQEVGSTAN